jgi:hypothetical protein
VRSGFLARTGIPFGLVVSFGLGEPRAGIVNLEATIEQIDDLVADLSRLQPLAADVDEESRFELALLVWRAAVDRTFEAPADLRLLLAIDEARVLAADAGGRSFEVAVGPVAFESCAGGVSFESCASAEGRTFEVPAARC